MNTRRPSFGLQGRGTTVMRELSGASHRRVPDVPAIKVLERRAADVHPLMYAAAAAFVLYFAVG